MSEVVEKFNEIKQLVADLELDAVKNGERGNNAAGVRVRKGLRLLKRLAGALVKVTLIAGKEKDKTDEA